MYIPNNIRDEVYYHCLKYQLYKGTDDVLEHDGKDYIELSKVFEITDSILDFLGEFDEKLNIADAYYEGMKDTIRLHGIGGCDNE
jgi:hypothetical protein